MILKEWKNAVGTKQLRCDMVIATTKMIVMKRCACKMSGGNDVENDRDDGELCKG